MGSTDQESDPSKRIPTIIWLVLGIVCVLVFVVMAELTGGHLQRKAVGPPAGASKSAPAAIVDKQAD
jgi:hypothetical protein